MAGTSKTEDGAGGPDRGELSRRGFIGGTSAALVAAGAPPLAADEARAATVAPRQEVTAPRTAIRLTINGASHQLEVEDRWTLNELLRDELDLIGSKLGCNRGECGACTVLVDGQPVYSCSTLAVWTDGKEVVTVEGLAEGGELSPLQEAFITNNAPQCGFCTPGQLMTATALLEDNPRPSADQVKHALAGNLCRCSNYNSIVEAVLEAAGGAQ